MQAYIYKLKDDNGKILYGFMEAVDKKDLKRKIRSFHFYFIGASSCRKEEIFKRTTGNETLLMFTHGLSTLIGAGIPLLSAMNMLWRQEDDSTMQMVIGHLRWHVEQGGQMSDAMSDFPNIFPGVYRALIRIAEKSGGLVYILKNLGEYLHYQQQIRTRVKKATIYPTVVIIFAVLVLLGMFTFVVPIFHKILTKLNVKLPLLTQLVLNFSKLITTWYFDVGLILTVLFIFFLYRKLNKNPLTGQRIDSLKLRIPVIGKIIYTMGLSRFVNSMSILINAGVPIVESFEAAKSTAVNRTIIRGIDKVQRKVEQGGSLKDSFRTAKIFPEILVDMVGVGEAGGTIPAIFHTLAVHFDEQIDYKLNKVLTLLEPFLIIFVGCIVILTLLAVYLPIFSIWKTLSS